MTDSVTACRFEATLLQPAAVDAGEHWRFLVLPKSASDTLPRRGRTSVQGTINGHDFKATLEPDGKLSHWLKLDASLSDAIEADTGDTVNVELAPLLPEPEPELPEDLRDALAACPKAKATWESTTTIARVDWIHWAVSAKQQKTRDKRVADACEMLAAGKRRVCCFDQSGFYSKSLSAPKAAAQRRAMRAKA